MSFVDPRQHPHAPEKNLQWVAFLLCINLSVVLHVCFLLALPFLSMLMRTPVEPARKRKFITFQRIQRKTVFPSQKARQKAKEKRKKEEKKAKKEKGQVVELPPSQDKPPERYKYLSEHNTRTRKETVARNRRLRDKRVTKRLQRPRNRRLRRPTRLAMRMQRAQRPQRQRAPARRQPRPTPPRKAPPRRRAPKQIPLKKSKRGKQAKPNKGKPTRVPKRKKLKFKTAKNYKKIARATRKSIDRKANRSIFRGHKRGDRRRGRSVQLQPNLRTLSGFRGSPAPDHLPNVPKGDQTELNSKKWLYATFFNRVKRFVRQHWSPAEKYRSRDPYGKVYGVKDRLTVLSITLDAKGKLKSAKIARSSGLAFLDKEAIRSFQAAQPFLNPPKGLIDKDGLIRFRFSFFVYNSYRARFRLFR